MEDWMIEAAKELTRFGDAHEETYRSIITKHSPFKSGVAYMPVPRCETCAQFIQHKDPELGVCLKLNQLVRTDFGCVQWKDAKVDTLLTEER
jgi:hypothetical protein